MSERSTVLWPTPQVSNRKSRRALRPHALGGESSPPGLEQAVELSLGHTPPELFVPIVSRQLTLWSEAFPVSRTVLLVEEADLPTSAISGLSSPDSFASCNPDGSWRKTCQGYSQVTLDGSLAEYSETWPRAGMTRNGTAYRRVPLAPLTGATASGSWPTPKANEGYTVAMWPTPCAEDAKHVPYQKGGHGTRYPMLLGAVDPARMWPTPMTRDGLWTTPCSDDTSFRKAEYSQGGTALSAQAGGSLNPTWVEWLMGYPLGWTVSEAWATRSSRRSRNGSHAESSRSR
jgi:DNA (cytosine-5)-methyltransferase 1